MTKNRLARLGLVALILLSAFVSHLFEARRLEQAVPGTAPQAQPFLLDHAVLEADLRWLADPARGGRKTGSAGNRAARDYIAARFAALGLQAFDGGFVQPFSFTHKSIRGLLTPGQPYETRYEDAANVVGFIRGASAPGLALVISAHFDHLGTRKGELHPGADDNASGTAALLQLAAWFSQHPPQHSIIFAAFDGEELGKQGAYAFMAKPPTAAGTITANVNMDMLAHNDQNQLFASGLYHYPQLWPYLQGAIAQGNVEIHLGHDKPLWLVATDDWTNSSDHAAFHVQGIPYLYFGVADHKDYHAPSDTVANVNLPFFGRAAEFVLRFARTLDGNLGKLAG